MEPEDELYGLPLDEFTAARNELAKRLRKEGEKERADAVRALAKPSVAAWTVNQLARRRPARVGALLEAGEALRAAALQGGDELREATRRERELVAELRREARSLLQESGRPASDALLERVAATLSNAALDPEARSLLEAGRLPEEVESRGFDAYEGLAVPAAAPAKAKGKAAASPTRDEAAERRRRAEERKRAAELRKRATALERTALAAEREAARAAEAAAEAAKAASQARRAADEARFEAEFAAQGH